MRQKGHKVVIVHLVNLYWIVTHELSTHKPIVVNQWNLKFWKQLETSSAQLNVGSDMIYIEGQDGLKQV